MRSALTRKRVIIEYRRQSRPLPGAMETQSRRKALREVIDVREFTSEFGTYPTITVKVDDGPEVIWHAFHTVGKSELARQRPEIGDRIAVKYFGRKNDVNYELYRVLVEKAEPQPTKALDWDQVAAAAESELGEADAPLLDDRGESA
jgi:hypothetical protein